MWFAYIDESKDQNKFGIYSALIINTDRWAETNEKLKAFRTSLRDRYGIFISHELHAWEFAAGKGRVSDRVRLKPRRAQVFREVLRFISESKFAGVMNSCNTTEQYAFERLMNRNNRTAVAKKAKRAALFCFAVP